MARTNFYSHSNWSYFPVILRADINFTASSLKTSSVPELNYLVTFGWEPFFFKRTAPDCRIGSDKKYELTLPFLKFHYHIFSADVRSTENSNDFLNLCLRSPFLHIFLLKNIEFWLKSKNGISDWNIANFCTWVIFLVKTAPRDYFFERFLSNVVIHSNYFSYNFKEVLW